MKQFLAMLLFAAPLFAQSLPPYFPLPAGAQVSNVTVENFSEAEFLAPNDQKVVQRGKHWYADVALSGVPEDAEQPQVWARIKPALVKAGWAPVVEVNQNPFSGVMKNAAKNAWAEVDVYGPGDVRVNIIEAASLNTSFVLNPPDKLAPLPGSKPGSSGQSDQPMTVQLPGQDEPEIVATGSTTSSYEAPAGMSNVAFDTLYVNALKQAGWDIVENSQSMNQTDVAITAHYTKNDRNIWSNIHYGGGEYTIETADAGAQKLAAQLAKNCHVPVYGILFDFNKATLRPDSEGALNKVKQLFASDPNLKLVVEGHTDNVGGAASNQKLSEARAASVVSWLTAHGVPAARVSAKGYGLTKPVASNEDAAGRAKNRRVELRKEGCNS